MSCWTICGVRECCRRRRRWGGDRPVVGYLALLRSVFLIDKSLPNFGLEKYDFHLYTGFFMEKKWVQIRQILKEKKNNSKLQNLHDKLQRVAKNILKILLFCFPFLTLICNQIWLNLFFWMITTSTTSQNPWKKKKKASPGCCWESLGKLQERH